MAATQKNAYSQHKYPALAIKKIVLRNTKKGNESYLRMNKLYSIWGAVPPDPPKFLNYWKPPKFFSAYALEHYNKISM